MSSSKTLITLDKQSLLLLAIEMNTPTLLNFCKSSRRINDLVCKQDQIWIDKLRKEYNFNFLKSNNDTIIHRSPRIYYNLFYYQPEDVEFIYSESSKTNWFGKFKLINHPNLYQNTIFEAIRLHFLDLVEYMIDKYNYVNSDFILYAAKYGNEEIFKFLLQKTSELKSDEINLILSMEWAIENRFHGLNIFNILLDRYKQEFYEDRKFKDVIIRAIQHENYPVLVEISKFLNDGKHFDVFSDVLKATNLSSKRTDLSSPMTNLKIAKILYNNKNINFSMFIETVKNDNVEFLKFLTSINDLPMNDKEINKMGNKISKQDGTVLNQIGHVMLYDKAEKILKYYLSLGTYNYLIKKFPEYKAFIDDNFNSYTASDSYFDYLM